MLAAGMGFLVLKILQVRRRPVEIGASTIIGANGVVRRDGMVFVNGELWRARSDGDEPLRSGEEVEVQGVDGLELRVKPRGA
jgi:membrane-bound ClpP family serine protease